MKKIKAFLVLEENVLETRLQECITNLRWFLRKKMNVLLKIRKEKRRRFSLNGKLKNSMN
eukprot:snap_masked-scaffold_21-processed-gene-2.36-mRNA-1 protein AED:1.00 eAED:1.00 QI:0/0/0/0/1/1/2/0/59